MNHVNRPSMIALAAVLFGVPGCAGAEGPTVALAADSALEQLRRNAGEMGEHFPTTAPAGVIVTGQGTATKIEALAALMARTQADLADLEDCRDFRLGSGGIYGSGLFNRGGIWCSVEHECPQGTCDSKHRLISPEQLDASPFGIVGQELVYKSEATFDLKSATVSGADLKTAFKRVLEQGAASATSSLVGVAADVNGTAAQPRECPTRMIQITGSALRQGRAILALEEHGCEIEVKSCSLGGLAGSAIILQIRKASTGGNPRRTEALFGSLEFDRRMSELERLGYKVDTVCYAHHFSGTQAVIQYSKR